MFLQYQMIKQEVKAKIKIEKIDELDNKQSPKMKKKKKFPYQTIKVWNFQLFHSIFLTTGELQCKIYLKYN